MYTNEITPNQSNYPFAIEGITRCGVGLYQDSSKWECCVDFRYTSSVHIITYTNTYILLRYVRGNA